MSFPSNAATILAISRWSRSGDAEACTPAKSREELGIRTVIVPEYAGALSALGMLMADAVRDYAAGVLGRRDIEKMFAILEQRARKESPGAEIERTADLRYRGQSYELNVPWNNGDPATLFHREHEKIYGYANPGRDVEIVTIRVRARTTLEKPNLVRSGAAKKGKPEQRRIWTGGGGRKSIAGSARASPIAANRARPWCSIMVPPRWFRPKWNFRVDPAGNLLLTV